MSTFITIDDYKGKRSARILDLITGEDDSILNTAETTAIGIITDRLAERYDLAAELAKTDTSRNVSLVRWILALSIYDIYSRIPDEQVPERVIKDYDDTMSELEKIQIGKLGCSLTRETDTEGETITRFRMGNNTPRTHDPYQY